MWLTNIGTLFTGYEFLSDVNLRIEGDQFSEIVSCHPGLEPESSTGSRVEPGMTGETIDCQNKVLLPGFIDCHTHLVFAGNRAHEFELRSKGASYSEIMAAGGGIRNTMQATRQASKQELIDLSLPRLARMRSRGVSTVEIKTGYGLSLESELKMLEVIAELRTLQPVELEATFLGAHAVPPEFDADSYVKHVIKDMLPAVKSQNIAKHCDVFVEKGAFSVSQARQIFEKAQDLGLRVRIHAEQLSHSGGAKLAAELGALSASHLEYATQEDAKAMAEAGVVAELLPIAQEFLGVTQMASGRMLADQGVKVAVATDCNPGSAMCDDLLLAARLAVTRGGLSCEEALKGITAHAALALGRKDIGVIEPGAKAHWCLLDTSNWVDLFYDWSNSYRVTIASKAVTNAS